MGCCSIIVSACLVIREAEKHGPPLEFRTFVFVKNKKVRKGKVKCLKNVQFWEWISSLHFGKAFLAINVEWKRVPKLTLKPSININVKVVWWLFLAHCNLYTVVYNLLILKSKLWLFKPVIDFWTFDIWRNRKRKEKNALVFVNWLTITAFSSSATHET